MKTSHLENIQESFIRQAADFESDRYHLSKKAYLEDIIKKTIPQSTDQVLEVAAGTCVCGRTLAPHVAHVVCLDATEAMLEIG